MEGLIDSIFREVLVEEDGALRVSEFDIISQIGESWGWSNTERVGIGWEVTVGIANNLFLAAIDIESSFAREDGDGVVGPDFELELVVVEKDTGHDYARGVVEVHSDSLGVIG